MTIRNIVLWSATQDPAFLTRYVDEHMPLVRALPGLIELTVSPLRSRSHSLIAELWFSDLDAMKAAFGSAAGAALLSHTAELESGFDLTTTSLVALAPFA